MSDAFPRRWCGALLVSAALPMLLAASSAGTARIWDRAGPFEACLERGFEAWVKGRAELVVNEDPRASAIDDAGVASWTAETLDACRTQAGGGSADAEARFAKHMAHWRDHIYERARNLKEKLRPD
jgi:hypothetical protein